MHLVGEYFPLREKVANIDTFVAYNVYFALYYSYIIN